MELEDRLKEFTYVFIRCFEEKLKYWQKYLEDRPDKASASKAGIAVATAVSAIPQVGKGLSGVIRQGDQFVQARHEMDTAQNMADITFYSENNKDAFRMILIEGAFDVFCRYEYQFSLVSTKGGGLRAMQKLGSDATHRIIAYLLEEKTVRNLTPEWVAKGIVLGKSPRNSKKIVSNGRTLTVNGETVSTADFYSNTGVRTEDNGVITYYKHTECQPALRHRLIFHWEDPDLIRSTYDVDRPEYCYKYRFINENRQERIEAVRIFVTTKNPIEDVKEFIRVRDDELELIIKNANNELKEIYTTGANQNVEHHRMTREVIVETQESIIAYLNDMICATLRQNLEEDRTKREEYDRKRREEEEDLRKKVEERHVAKEEEEKRLRVEEDRKKKEETDMLLAKVQEQHAQLPDKAIIIDGDRLKVEAKKVEKCISRESHKVEREAKRVRDQIKSFKLKW